MLNVRDTPSEGPDGARVTIVEFSDMQCAYCKKRSADWEPLLAKLSGDEAGDWSTGTNYELKFLKSGRPIRKAAFRRVTSPRSAPSPEAA